MKRPLIVFAAILLSLSFLIMPVSLVGADAGGAEAGLWHLDEGSGLVAQDSSGNDNDGTITGATWVTDGKFGKALSFDGNDYVRLPASNQILDSDDFTIHTWFKTTINHPVYGSGEGRLVNLHRATDGIDSTSALALYLEKDKIGLLYYTGAAHVWLKYDVAYDDGNWHSLAVTHEGNTYRLYYDGVAVLSQNDAFGDFGIKNAYLGTYNSSERFFQGSLDEVGIWARALSPEEIAGLANPVTSMAKFKIKHAFINFTSEDQEDRVSVQGVLKLDLANGDGVNIAEGVTVTIGSLTETITMVDKGKKEKMWVYNRPQNGDGDIKYMVINWKTGEFQIRIDRADLSGMTNPDAVTIGVLIGDDLGETTIDMKEKRQWQYGEHSIKC